MLIANDENNIRVMAHEGDKNKQYFCPRCGESVVLKQGNINIHHFSHKIKSECSNYKPMTEWHYNWQLLYDESCREVIMEEHRADVFVNNTVIEFQHSHLPYEEMLKRINYYNNLGYEVVFLFDLRNRYINKYTNNYNEGFKSLVFEWKYPSKSIVLPVGEIGEKYNLFFQISDDKIIWVDDALNGWSLFTAFFNGKNCILSKENFIKCTKNIRKYKEKMILNKIKVCENDKDYHKKILEYEKEFIIKNSSEVSKIRDSIYELESKKRELDEKENEYRDKIEQIKRVDELFLKLTKGLLKTEYFKYNNMKELCKQFIIIFFKYMNKFIPKEDYNFRINYLADKLLRYIMDNGDIDYLSTIIISAMNIYKDKKLDYIDLSEYLQYSLGMFANVNTSNEVICEICGEKILKYSIDTARLLWENEDKKYTAFICKKHSKLMK